MSTFRLMLAEIAFRKASFFLSLTAIAAAAMLFVSGPSLIAGFGEETNQRVKQRQQDSEKTIAQLRQQTIDRLDIKQEELRAELENLALSHKGTLAKLESDTAAELADLDKKTKRAMRDLGFNLLIVHQKTNMDDFYLNYKAVDMPQKYVQMLATSKELTKIRHIVATLKEKYKWNDREVFLMGQLPSAAQAHLDKKPPMGYDIKLGTVILGNHLAFDNKKKPVHKVGDKIKIGDGKNSGEYTVAEVLPELGNEKDIMLAMNLADAQKVLNKPNTVNQILALGCKCQLDRIAEIREQLELVLPDTRVTEDRTKAIARAKQRKLVSENRGKMLAKYQTQSKQIIDDARQQHAIILTRVEQENNRIVRDAKEKETEIMRAIQSSRNDVQRSFENLIAVVTPLVVVTCGVWVGMLAWMNVRQRRTEIGLLRALGKRSPKIAALFLGRGVLLGLLGGVAGCLLGYVFPRWLAMGPLEVSAESLRPSGQILLLAVLGAPLVSAMASYLPTLMAIRQDPAAVLTEA